jgi:hypothetical protein
LQLDGKTPPQLGIRLGELGDCRGTVMWDLIDELSECHRIIR